MSAPHDGTTAMTRGDRLLLRGLLVVLALAASLTPIRNYDYWWHLKTGGLILSRHEVPRVDPYSFTATGAFWVDHEWLSQVVLYLAHCALGPAGIVLLKTALVLGLCLLWAGHARREGLGPAEGALLLSVALVGASFRLDARPELATLLLIPLVLHLVLQARDTGRFRPLLFLPLLSALGANLHPGAVLLPALLLPGICLTFIAEHRSLWLRGPEGTARRFPGSLKLLTGVLGAAAAVGINPYGYRIYAVPFELRQLLRTLPSPNLEWARPGWSDFPLFWLAAALTVVVVLCAPRRIDLVATTALLLSACLAAAHLRNIGLFFVLLPYGLARPVRGLVVAWANRLGQPARFAGRVRPGFVIAAVILLCAVPLPGILPPRIAWGMGMAAGNEPRAAVDFLESTRIGERLYNDVRFGGYLIWRRFPDHPVFIDGRNEVYPGILREVFAAVGDSRRWELLLDRLEIDAAFLRYTPSLDSVVRPGGDGAPARIEQRAFAATHFPQENWALVYWDDDAMIVVRRSTKNAALIARREYRAIHPEDWRHSYASVVTGREPLEPLLEELQRKVGEDPDCARARFLLSTFLPLTGAVHPSPGATR